MSKIKIFPIYHNKSILFQSDVYEPIQTGCSNTDLELGILKDNTGDHISNKNTQLGELTAWYWIWKNYLPQHPELEYIGFCHYRRFLDFNRAPAWGIKQPFAKEFYFQEFKDLFFNSFTEEMINNSINHFDVILPQKRNLLKNTIYQQYISGHNKKDIELLMELIRSDYPDYVEDMNNFLHNKSGYFCLNFVMKVELFDEMMTWSFDILNKLENKIDFTRYVDYLLVRTPAFIIERFFNVWLIHQIKIKNLKVLERESYLLIPEFEKKKKMVPGVFYIKKAILKILFFMVEKLKSTDLPKNN
ncbi:MAG: DUF4422 domain-containing protein [Akkermansia sp.]